MIHAGYQLATRAAATVMAAFGAVAATAALAAFVLFAIRAFTGGGLIRPLLVLGVSLTVAVVTLVVADLPNWQYVPTTHTTHTRTTTAPRRRSPSPKESS